MEGVHAFDGGHDNFCSWLAVQFSNGWRTDIFKTVEDIERYTPDDGIATARILAIAAPELKFTVIVYIAGSDNQFHLSIARHVAHGYRHMQATPDRSTFSALTFPPFGQGLKVGGRLVRSEGVYA
jgi:hypothetical protein